MNNENQIPEKLKKFCYMPETIFEYNKSYLFGLISINILVEDRRPDLTGKIGKYKHLLYFKIFWKHYSIILRTTNSTGFYKLENKVHDINYVD